ncbi:MAG: hypothetical protein K2Q20_02670 [Phycisphaerales bacterium]|nr:hypothetical protein [Phycisphaerales bacterium]
MWLTELRQAVIALLTGLTTTGPRVFDQEPYALHLIPCLVVSTSASSISSVSVDVPQTFQVDSEVQIEAIVSVATGLQDLQDTVTAEIMVALANGVTLDGISRPLTLTSVDQIEINATGERPVARRTVTFICGPLFVKANTPSVLT